MRIMRTILVVCIVLLFCTSSSSQLNQSEQDRRIWSFAAQGNYSEAIIEMQMEIRSLQEQLEIVQYRADTLERNQEAEIKISSELIDWVKELQDRIKVLEEGKEGI